MSRNTKPVVTPVDVLVILRDHPRRWIVPTVVVALLAAGYAVVRSAAWDASQALMVRDEAMNSAAHPGKFQQPDDMKTVQETILELARSRTVLSAALADVGPDAKHNADQIWPTDSAIAALQGHVKLTPPKGAEFGKTEVFYLNVEAESRPRAIALAGAICKQLQARSQDLRDQKAQSLIAELSKTVGLANAELATTTNALTRAESQVGADLGELRMLNETGGGDSPLHRAVNEMDQELRQAHQTIDGNQELLTLLEASKTDARSLAAAPNRLLEAQPVLRRLKDGLVDAQLRTAQLSGSLMPDHPSLKAAKTAEDEIATRVRSEVDAAIVGVQSELQVAQQRAKLLESQLTDARARLSKLADMRAQYANLVAERNQRADILKSAEQQMAEARASSAAARTASVIAAIDAPVAGDAPVGPGKATITLAGALGGLMLGLGLVFLTVQPSKSDVAVQTGEAVQNSAANQAHPVEDVVLNRHPSPIAAGNWPVNGSLQGHGLSLKQALRKLAVAG